MVVTRRFSLHTIEEISHEHIIINFYTMDMLSYISWHLSTMLLSVSSKVLPEQHDCPCPSARHQLRHSQTTDTGLLHCVECLFALQFSLASTAPTTEGWPG